MRGNPAGVRVFLILGGSIPARAGEPGADRLGSWSSGVYPRACGGTDDASEREKLDGGLSPRVRGNPINLMYMGRPLRSIPARAGEPIVTQRYQSVLRVYPRACGGTLPAGPAGPTCCGLSPRVRGNRCRRPPHSATGRSIPARAGEPTVSRSDSGFSKVYPRACGGTRCPPVPATSDPGLSPRVRGNRRRKRMGHARLGSIPARAGEPQGHRRAARRRWVYPRACGGTPVDLLRHSRRHRSIPARAGEPSVATRRSKRSGVYPRACGGTLPPSGVCQRL